MTWWKRRAGQTPHTTVRLVTRRDCPLCEKAERVVQEECASQSVTLTIQDIDLHPELAHLSDDVPIVYINEVQHAYWRVDPHRFRQALKAPPKPPKLKPEA